MSVPDLPELLWGTVLLRPYVFVFLGCFLFASVTRMGLLRTLVFMVGAYLIAFLSEYSSTRNGFPYGMYHYIESTRDRELWIANVPFMDSLSYVFLSYFSIRTALFLIAPLRRTGGDIRCITTREVVGSGKLLFTAPLLFMLLDMAIDPVALRGDRWFLGKIYFYPEKGLHFGVPLSNYAGWYLVGLVITRLYQTIEGSFGGSGGIGRRDFFLRDLLEPGLYLSVLIFNLAVAWYIGEPMILANDTAILFAVSYPAARRIPRRTPPERR